MGEMLNKWLDELPVRGQAYGRLRSEILPPALFTPVADVTDQVQEFRITDGCGNVIHCSGRLVDAGPGMPYLSVDFATGKSIREPLLAHVLAAAGNSKRPPYSQTAKTISARKSGKSHASRLLSAMVARA